MVELAVSTEPIDITVDSSIGSVYLGLHELAPEERETAGVTHTLEKHGILLHWNGHGKLTCIEVKATGRPVRVRETTTTTAI